MNLDPSDITQIEVEDDRLIVHYRRVRQIDSATPVSRPDLSDFWDQGYLKILFSWSGFGYGYHPEKGWMDLDITGRRTLKPIGDPFKNSNYILALVIPETEWDSRIASKIQIVRKSHKTVVRHDYRALAREFLTLNPKPSFHAFLKSRKIPSCGFTLKRLRETVYVLEAQEDDKNV